MDKFRRFRIFTLIIGILFSLSAVAIIVVALILLSALG